MLLLNFGEYDWIVTKEALVEDRKHCEIGQVFSLSVTVVTTGSFSL